MFIMLYHSQSYVAPMFSDFLRFLLYIYYIPVSSLCYFLSSQICFPLYNSIIFSNESKHCFVIDKSNLLMPAYDKTKYLVDE